MEDVVVNVYDLSRGVAATVSKCMLEREVAGIWHTGVIVYGTEYFVAGGVKKTIPGQFGKVRKLDVACTLRLGKTAIKKHRLDEYVSTIEHQYSSSKYNLLLNNCNHFTNDVLKFLQVNLLPKYISNQVQTLTETASGYLVVDLVSVVAGADPLAI